MTVYDRGIINIEDFLSHVPVGGDWRHLLAAREFKTFPPKLHTDVARVVFLLYYCLCCDSRSRLQYSFYILMLFTLKC